jgi:hypothetical protein
MPRNKFGIVIPCYNEAGNLKKLIDACEALLKDDIFQFVLVDNGSTDNSMEILAAVSNPRINVISLEKNAGYGGGILAGLNILESDFVGWTHADLQTDLVTSLTSVTEQDFEFFKGVRTGRSLTDRFLSFCMGVICSILFRKHLSEINAQPTVMSQKIFKTWENPPTDFSLDLYSLVIAKRMNAKIIRSKFLFSQRVSGHSAWNFGFKSRIKMMSRTLKYANQLYKNGAK